MHILNLPIARSISSLKLNSSFTFALTWGDAIDDEDYK